MPHTTEIPAPKKDDAPEAEKQQAAQQPQLVSPPGFAYTLPSAEQAAVRNSQEWADLCA
jgi:hypothetical protein